MDIKLEVLSAIQNKRKYNNAQLEQLTDYATKVSNMESDGIADRLQDSGGPGRGKYQYELKKNPLGKDGSGANKTAINRFKSFTKASGIKLDEDIKNLIAGDNVDFSTLPENLQDAIFFADASRKPQFNMDDLVNRKTSAADMWADSHWMGSSNERSTKVRQFTEKNKSAEIQMLIDFFNKEQEAPLNSPLIKQFTQGSNQSAEKEMPTNFLEIGRGPTFNSSLIQQLTQGSNQ